MKFRTYIGDLGFTSFPHFLSNQMDLNKTSRSKKEKLPKKKKKRDRKKKKRKKEKEKKSTYLHMMKRDHRSQKEAQISNIEAELKYMTSFFSLVFLIKPRTQKKS